MSVYVNTEVAEDSLISDLMQCFLKTDFKDDKFTNISRRMKELKHGEEDEKMCTFFQDSFFRFSASDSYVPSGISLYRMSFPDCPSESPMKFLLLFRVMFPIHYN